MEDSLMEILDPWLMREETIDWAIPRSQCLSSIRDLRFRQPCIELLEATLAFWDPIVHVFRFHQDEMCPTLEEFQAYVPSFANLDVLAVPPFQANMEQILQTKLNIPGELTAGIIQNGELNVIRLIELYGPEGALGDFVGEAHRRFVLSICALAAYMLIPANGRVSPKLVSIASQMDAQKNIMPVILAETLLGLDLVKLNQADSFSGCPVLLQLWLSDKLGVLEVPQAGFEHFPRLLIDKPMLFPKLIVEEWFAFLNDMQPEDIVWRCPWLNIPKMTINSAGYSRVVVAGLSSFTFYIPGRTLRQLGRTQGYKRYGAEDFDIPVFNSWTLRCYKNNWDNRALREPTPGFKTWLENRYVRWLHAEVEARLRGFF